MFQVELIIINLFQVELIIINLFQVELIIINLFQVELIIINLFQVELIIIYDDKKTPKVKFELNYIISKILTIVITNFPIMQ